MNEVLCSCCKKGNNIDTTVLTAVQEFYIQDPLKNGSLVFKHVFDELFKLGYGIDKVYNFKNETTTFLKQSVAVNRLDIAEYLLKKGANPSDINNKSIVFDAVRNENMEFLKFLIENGADINVKSYDGSSILQYALKYFNTDFIKRLIDEFKFNLNENSCSGPSLILLALNRKSYYLAELFISKGVDIDKVNASKMTVLQEAVNSFNIEAVEYLLNKGANPNVSDPEGYSVLMKLVMNCDGSNENEILRILPLFKDKAVNFEHATRKGYRLIHLFCELGFNRIFDYLLEQNVDLRAETIDGRLPYDLAAGSRNMDLATRIQRLGFRFKARDQVEFEGKICLVCNNGNCDIKTRCGHFYHTECIEEENCLKCGRTVSSRPEFEKIFAHKKIPVELLRNKSLPELEYLAMEACRDQKIPFTEILNEIICHLDRKEFSSDYFGNDFGFFNSGYGNNYVNDYSSSNSSHHYLIGQLMFAACQYNHIKILRFLIKCEKNMFSMAYNDPITGLSPLHMACIHKNSAPLVELILRSDSFRIDSLSTNGVELAPLHVACLFGNLDTIKFLLKKGASLDLETNKEDLHSVVLFCFQYANFDVIELLAKSGKIRPNMTNSEIASALHYVAMNPDPKVLELFEVYDFELNARSQQERIKIAKYLLKDKSSVVYDRSFNTILAIALLNDNMELFQYVLDNHVENINDHYLFHAISRYCRTDLFDFVLNLYADINRQNPNGIKR